VPETADLDLDGIPGLLEIVHQIFIPRSVMGTGTRSATAEVLPVSAEAATRATLPVRISRRATVEGRAAGGTLLARREAHPQRRFVEELVSVARVLEVLLSAGHPSPDRVSEVPDPDLSRTRASDRTHNLVTHVSIPLVASADLAIADLITEDLAVASAGAGMALEGSIGSAMDGEEASGRVTVGAEAFSQAALAGVLARVGHTGEAIGGWDGIPFGTTLTGPRRGLRITTGLILTPDT
jgi:hypothetical protein